MGTWMTIRPTGSRVSWTSSCGSGGVGGSGGEGDDGCGGGYGETCSIRPRTRSGSRRRVGTRTYPRERRWPGSVLPGRRESLARGRHTWTADSRKRSGTWPSCRRGPWRQSARSRTRTWAHGECCDASRGNRLRPGYPRVGRHSGRWGILTRTQRRACCFETA